MIQLYLEYNSSGSGHVVNYRDISGSWDLRRYVGTKSIEDLADNAYLWKERYGSAMKIVIVCNCGEADLQTIYERVLSTVLNDLSLRVEVVVRVGQFYDGSGQVNDDLRKKMMDWCMLTDKRKIYWCNDKDDDDIFAVTNRILLPSEVGHPKVSKLRGSRCDIL